MHKNIQYTVLYTYHMAQNSISVSMTRKSWMTCPSFDCLPCINHMKPGSRLNSVKYYFWGNYFLVIKKIFLKKLFSQMMKKYLLKKYGRILEF